MEIPFSEHNSARFDEKKNITEEISGVFPAPGGKLNKAYPNLEFKPETTKKSGSKSSMNQGQREEFKNFMPNWLLYAIILLLGLLVTLLIEFTD